MILMLGKTEVMRRRGQQRTNKMVGWYHQLDGGSEGQGSLAYCSPWGRKELDTSSLLVVSCRGWWAVTEPRCFGIFWLSVRLLRGP